MNPTSLVSFVIIAIALLSGGTACRGGTRPTDESPSVRHETARLEGAHSAGELPDLEVREPEGDLGAACEKFASAEPRDRLYRIGSKRLRPLTLAARYAASVSDASPRSMEDVAAYLFAWPVRQTIGGLLPIREAPPRYATDEARIAYGDLAQAEEITIQFEEGTLTSESLAPIEPTTAVVVHHAQPIPPMYDLGPALPPGVHSSPPKRDRLTLAEVEVIGNEEERWQRVFKYRQEARDPADARVAAAAFIIQFLLTEACANRCEIPSTWEELVAWSGFQLTNLDEGEGPLGAVNLFSDGKQAFRLRVQYPSGVIEDTVLFYLWLAGPENSYQPLSYESYLSRGGAPLEHWKSLSVAARPVLPLFTVPESSSSPMESGLATPASGE